jgi:hypothetical protein
VEIIGIDVVDGPVNIMLTPSPYGAMAVFFINCNACKLMWEEKTRFGYFQQ